MTAEPNTALFQVYRIFHVPDDRLPRRVEDQVTGIAKQLNTITARLKTIQKVKTTRKAGGLT